jgi:hypothetical protein
VDEAVKRPVLLEALKKEVVIDVRGEVDRGRRARERVIRGGRETTHTVAGKIPAND